MWRADVCRALDKFRVTRDQACVIKLNERADCALEEHADLTDGPAKESTLPLGDETTTAQAECGHGGAETSPPSDTGTSPPANTRLGGVSVMASALVTVRRRSRLRYAPGFT